MTPRLIGRRSLLAGLALAPLAGVAPRTVLAQDDEPLAVTLAAIRGVGRETSPWGVVVDEDGFLFVSDSRTSRVVRISPDGFELLVIVEEGNAAGSISRPKGIALGPDGLLYVVDGGNRRIQAFTRDGEFQTSGAVREAARASSMRRAGLRSTPTVSSTSPTASTIACRSSARTARS